MALYRNEMKLVDCRGFGPISQTQQPKRTIELTDGWKAVGVMSAYGQIWIVAQRRRWFWMSAHKSWQQRAEEKAIERRRQYPVG